MSSPALELTLNDNWYIYIYLIFRGLTELKISFDHMSYTARNAKGKIRRLCTYSWGDTPITRPFVTKWLWYWQDEKTKWFEYGVEVGLF